MTAYYGSVNAPFPDLKSASPAVIKIGEQLTAAGDDAKGIPGCDQCHGPKGNGQLGIAPYLGGQYADYIAFTLHMWQRGYRKNMASDPWLTRADPSEAENAVLATLLLTRGMLCRMGAALLSKPTNVAIDEGQAGRAEGTSTGDYVRLSISDTGVGMAPDVLPRVFEPFFRPSGSKPAGSGWLGLSGLLVFERSGGR